jgi:signal transduction histidine kinase
VTPQDAARRAEKAAAEDRLARLLAAVPVAALVLDGAGAIRGANARARALLQGPDAASLPPLERRPLADVLALPGPAPIAPSELEARLRGPDPGLVEVAIGALPEAEGGGFLALLRDRTPDERALRSRLTRERLEAVAQLAAGVAHEFNNIMATLYGFAQLARQDGQFHGDLVAAIEEYTERSREITRRLRSFAPARTEALAPIDLSEVVDEVLERAAPALTRAEITVRRRTEPSLPRTLGARGEIVEVFDALVENARDAIVKGGALSIDLRREGDALLARVTDSGTGVPRENLTRIFEPFFTMKSVDGGPVRGGLGLAVAFAHVRRHDGEMWAESEIGRGTTISVRLPLRGERRRRQHAAVPVERRRAPALVSRAVLAVDDDEGMLRLLEQILTGHDLVPARSVEEARAALHARRFDYVILDLLLPGDLDGYALFDEIMSAGARAKIILLTGSTEDDRLRSYIAKAYGYLRKPFGIKDIQSLIV